MNVPQRSGRRTPTRKVVVACAVALVVLGGCSGFEGENTTTTPPATATDTPTEPQRSGPRIGTPEIRPIDTSAEAVVEPAVEVLRTVEAYRVVGTVDVTHSNATGEWASGGVVTTGVNRTQRTLRTTTSVGPTGRAETYLADGVVYRRDPAFVDAYGTEWVVVDRPGEFATLFDRHDELAAHRVMLENAAVAVVGTQQLDGGYAYRLALDVDAGALNDFYEFEDGEGIDRVEATVWIRASSNRLVRAAGTIHRSMDVDGRTVTSTVEYDESFEYTSVTVSLPEAASSAVTLDGLPDQHHYRG